MAAEPVPPADELKPDAEKGKLFDMPRPALKVDASDPNVLKIGFSGNVELERGDARWVDFYNALDAGRDITLTVTAFVTGAKKTHRRDAEGNVDSVVEIKSAKVTDVHLEER